LSTKLIQVINFLGSRAFSQKSPIFMGGCSTILLLKLA